VQEPGFLRHAPHSKLTGEVFCSHSCQLIETRISKTRLTHHRPSRVTSHHSRRSRPLGSGSLRDGR
jgi:hypothetical protein